MSNIIQQMIDAARTLAILYEGFAGRAGSMTEEQATAEWAKVNNNAVAARENWQASGGGAHGPLR